MYECPLHCSCNAIRVSVNIQISLQMVSFTRFQPQCLLSAGATFTFGFVLNKQELMRCSAGITDRHSRWHHRSGMETFCLNTGRADSEFLFFVNFPFTEQHWRFGFYGLLYNSQTHWQSRESIRFFFCTVFIHWPMSSFPGLLAVFSPFQSISTRLSIHPTEMKHEGIKKHRRLSASTTKLNRCGANICEGSWHSSPYLNVKLNNHWSEAKAVRASTSIWYHSEGLFMANCAKCYGPTVD